MYRFKTCYEWGIWGWVCSSKNCPWPTLTLESISVRVTNEGKEKTIQRRLQRNKSPVVSEFQNNEYIVFLEDNWAVNLVVGNYDMIESFTRRTKWLTLVQWNIHWSLTVTNSRNMCHNNQQSTTSSTLHQEQIATEVHHLLQLTKQSIKAKPQPVEVHMGWVVFFSCWGTCRQITFLG